MMDFANMNWAAVGLGTVLAFGLGMLWFSPRLFGKTWSAGSHNIQPPASPPLAAMATQLAGTFLMALAIGWTETGQQIGLAMLIIVTIAVVQTAGGLFSQKTGAAALIDGSYVIAMGVLMILSQAVL